MSPNKPISYVTFNFLTFMKCIPENKKISYNSEIKHCLNISMWLSWCIPFTRSSLAFAQSVRGAVVRAPIRSAFSAPSSAISAMRPSWVNTSSSLSLWKFNVRSRIKNCKDSATFKGPVSVKVLFSLSIFLFCCWNNSYDTCLITMADKVLESSNNTRLNYHGRIQSETLVS